MTSLSQELALELVARLASVPVLLSSLEFLYRRRILADEGLMSWTVAQVRGPWLVAPGLGAGFNAVLAWPRVLGLVGVRAAVAAAVLLWPQGTPQPWPLLATAAVLNVLFFVRSRYGHDGADQMGSITFVALAIGVASTPATRAAALWFLALQAALAYGTAGVAKAVAPGWRNGSHLAGIMGTRMYGHAGLAAALRARPVLARALGFGTLAWECAFPLVLVLPTPAVVAFLASGIAFHVANAVFMGLNTFFWAFIATYPAILYCAGTRGW